MVSGLSAVVRMTGPITLLDIVRAMNSLRAQTSRSGIH
jgi:hypothetical protein